MIEIRDINYSIYSIKLRSTFQTALRSVDSFEVFKVQLTDSQGKIGVGEVVATPAITGITPQRVDEDFKSKILPVLKSMQVINSNDAYQELLAACPENPTARALGDLAICSFLDMPGKFKAKSDVTIPISEIDEIPELVRVRIDSGFNTFKIKLNDEALQSNLRKVALIHSLLPREGRLRIDPNQSWGVDYSIKFVEETIKAGIGIEYLEQPIPKDDYKGLKRIKSESQIEIMADESCFNMIDFERILEHKATDWVNVKILKAGGITPARQLARAVKDAGLKLSIGCMMESPIGVASAISLAAEFEPELVHDLDAAWWYPQSVLMYQKGEVQ